MKQLRWLIPAGCVSGGMFLLQKSYVAYGKWYFSIKEGDHSGAELDEINFWLFATPACLLLIMGVFLCGRWSVRRKND